jgi:hypothetical protein
MNAPRLFPVPARPIPARKRKRAKIDTGLRPGGTIYGPAYWPARGAYLWILTALLDPSLGLSAGEILCFCRLRFFGGKKDQCWPSQKTLGSEIGLSTSTMYRYLARLHAKDLIDARHCYRTAGVGGQTSNDYFPIWHQMWEDAWRAKHGTSSGLDIGDRFEWSLFSRERWPSLMLPLDVAKSVSPGAGLHYAVLLSRQKYSRSEHSTIACTNVELAAFGQIHKRLERDDRRKERHESSERKEQETTAYRKPFLHYPGQRVNDFNRELKLQGWLRIEPGFDASGRQTKSIISLLKSPTDTRRSPKKCPKHRADRREGGGGEIDRQPLVRLTDRGGEIDRQKGRR